MVMIPNLQEIPLRHSRLPHQPASQDHALGALLTMACGKCHCSLQAKDYYPESTEKMFMTSFGQPEGWMTILSVTNEKKNGRGMPSATC